MDGKEAGTEGEGLTVQVGGEAGGNGVLGEGRCTGLRDEKKKGEGEGEE